MEVQVEVKGKGFELLNPKPVYSRLLNPKP